MTNEEAREEAREQLERISSHLSAIGEKKDYTDIAINALEIELLTDKEQRIFLKAISREREVCQKIDDEYSDDDSKISLVRVCNSIERKVKKIWE